MGTCVGGSFALKAAASANIRERVSFIAAYTPYASMFTLPQDAANGTTVRAEKREPWQVDQLTRKVLVRSLTNNLKSDEAERLREIFSIPECKPDIKEPSENRRIIYALISHPDSEEALEIIYRLPVTFLDYLRLISPIKYLENIHAPLILLFHDQGDMVIPIGESRRLQAGLASH